MSDLIRRQLDRHLNQLRSLDTLDRPSQGWIKTIREALGLTQQQLSERLMIKRQVLDNYEKSEANNTITLKSLQNTAAAMNCRLYYAFVPEKSLQQTVDDQMEIKAKEIVNYISHSMALEDQQTVKEETTAQIKKIVEDLKRKKNISSIWEQNK